MEPRPIYFQVESYVQTSTGNKIATNSLIRGSDQILPSGKDIFQDKIILRGDLSTIKLGKYVIIQEYVTLRPAYKKIKGQTVFIPLSIGDHVIIEQNSIVCCSKIGSNVHIGKDCVIQNRCIIHDNSKILDGSVLIPDTVVPQFTVFGGVPAKLIAEMPEQASLIQKEDAISYYDNFLPKKE